MTIFCPTDFTVASHSAFQHGLGLALATRGKFTLMHVPTADEDGGSFPGIRSQLERWGRLPANSPESAVTALGLEAGKIVGRPGDPLDIVLHYLEHHPADLIVLNTHQREGRARWLGRAVAEPLARAAQVPTLFLPNGQGGLVNPNDGQLHLRRVLVPISLHPAPQLALNTTVSLLRSCRIVGANLTLLHVGPANDAPAVEIHAEGLGIGVHQEIRAGDPVEQILAAAGALKADLVVMATAGHHGFLDALRGSTTERVLRKLTCPLLAVPVPKPEPA